ncbi:hypothetical protein BH11PSE4_BH11PSE4_29340 [soil metagenome]
MQVARFVTSLLGALLAGAIASAALAQGSTGGSIGNSEKSLSGSRDEPRSVAPAVRERASRPEPRRASPRGGGTGSFDGAWTVVATGQCAGAGTFTVIIANGRVTGQNISGSVSPNGATRTISSYNGLTSIGTGRITGRTGSGTYTQSDGCSGSFRSVKN